MSDTQSNLWSMDSDEIINQLNDLLAAGHDINDILSSLDDVHIIANFDLLSSKGADPLSLKIARDCVSPIVVLNNIAVFKNHNIEVDVNQSIMNLEDKDVFSDFIPIIGKLLENGASPQVIVDKCMSAEGPIVYFIEQLGALLDAGAKVDGDLLVEKLINDEELFDAFNEDEDIQTLKKAGASPVAINKLEDFLHASQ